MPEDSRARLIAYLCQAGLSTVRANAVLDAYAHALAERIRAEQGTTSLENGHHFFSGMDFAADLIDPVAA
ncbi:hypothetical protein [Streptomyces drozdowiczii]|uniref:hypothetical protein n=1 Tax=Streptomyces drozdowiczii TaxID=202862 RepID=UPI00403D1AF5